jgi:hypothetical protein
LLHRIAGTHESRGSQLLIGHVDKIIVPVKDKVV